MKRGSDMQQITIFDAIAETRINIGDKVMIVQPISKVDAETDYYLSLFRNEVGKVCEWLPKMQYKVEFGGRVGTFKSHELRRVGSA